MPCYFPLRGYKEPFPSGKNGKHRIVFTKRLDDSVRQVEVPCGQCIGCRLERSRKWAARCINEASLYDDNCFITLTYSQEYLPVHGSLVPEHLTLFMKRLRKMYGEGIKFFACGEYGEKFSRPHYHACLFNHDFKDRKLLTVRNNVNLYTSDSLSKLWPYGFSTVGDVTFESAAYVARYIIKKITGEKADEHYKKIDYSSGEYVDIQPEFVRMSRRPGIGRDWLLRYKDDVYPFDEHVINGVATKPPRYYDNIYDMIDHESMESIKLKRNAQAYNNRDNTTLRRLKVREVVKNAQVNQLKRSYESED